MSEKSIKDAGKTIQEKANVLWDVANSLSDDKFSGFKFDYVISNPPFGIDRKVESKAVEKEALISDLEAYKKLLIYEVVTGKREVA